MGLGRLPLRPLESCPCRLAEATWRGEQCDDGEPRAGCGGHSGGGSWMWEAREERAAAKSRGVKSLFHYTSEMPRGQTRQVGAMRA